jgi:phosphoglycerol transferase MdoB-like AlkP superfamily enzyme
MLKRLLFIFIYLLAWVFFFEIARIFFLIYEWPYTQSIPARLALQSLWYGLKMDVSMACYITGIICLFVLAGLFIPFFNTKKIYTIYTAIILFIQLLLIMADAEIYKAWGSRIDYTPLKYFSSPKEMMASLSHLPLFKISLCLIIITIALVWLFHMLISQLSPLLNYREKRFLQAPVILLFSGLLVIPIRGGLQLSPLNQSSVYFSSSQFANHAALNASWNFMYSVTLMEQLSKNPYEYFSEKQASELVMPLFDNHGKTEQVVEIKDSLKPNILIIVWESFTEKAMHEKAEGKPVIQYFQQLIKEGIYFTNCYSSGDRTDKGISAVLSGYPALPKGSIVNYPGKTAKLQGLAKLFRHQGYATAFYYGGEPEFANIKSYLIAQEFERFTAKENFQASDMNSKWGAHDDVVMKRLLADLSTTSKPFFTTWLTLSSHEPFETPVESVFLANNTQANFFNSLHYTDSCIYEFIQEFKKLPVWNNTLVIITADHGHYLPATGKRADDYKIPVLWLGGALKKQDTLIKKTVSQLDIASSLVSQFHFSENPFHFSKNLFDSTGKGWAFFTYNDGIGLVNDSSRILFDNPGKRIVFQEGRIEKGMENIAKALMQVTYTDFLKK